MNCRYFCILTLVTITTALKTHKVTTHHGAIEGVKSTTYNGKQYYKFLGIPFAKPPLGKTERFFRTELIDPWNKTLQAIKEAPSCMQDVLSFEKEVAERIELQGAHNCLYLNIAVPKSKKRSLRYPVMVWIHGGGYVTGRGSFNEYPPDLFINHGVILVSIQYRLALNGFLSTNSTILPHANTGLHDQILALRWIKQNIQYFGGDPNRTVIFGGSAGASSVHQLSLIEEANGLFSGVIAQSGSAFSTWANRLGLFDEMTEAVKCQGTIQERFECLAGKSDTELLVEYKRVTGQCFKEGFWNIDECDIGTMVEQPLHEQSLIVEHPLKAVAKPNLPRVPIIFGYTKDDGDIFKYYVNKYKGLDVFIPSDLKMKVNRTSQEYKDLQRDVVKVYFKDYEHLTERRYRNKYYQYLTDVHFLRRIKKIAEIQAKYSKNVYFYKLSYNVFTHNKQGGNVVPHGGEIPYLFINKTAVGELPQSSRKKYFSMSKKIMKLWTNFAKTGDPNKSEKRTEIGSQSKFEAWKPIEENQFNYLNMDRSFKLEVNPSKEGLTFLDEVYKKYKAAEYGI